MAAENELNKEQQTATYIDQNGQKQTGVVSGENAGITPLSQPAAASSPQGGAGTHWDQMRNLYQQQYDEQTAANNAAYEAAAARAREVNQQNIETLNKGYQGTNRQLYRDYMNHQRTLPQEMAARGYSGGLSESAGLRLRNSYEEGLNENERARLGQVSTFDNNLAQQLYEAQATATAANQQANQQRLSYLTALQEQQYQDQQQRAATLASAGDFSGYRDLGYSDDQITYLQDIWARQNPALAYSLGKISAGTYYSLTGSYPPGYSTGSTRSSGGGGGSYNRNNNNSESKAFDYSKLGYSDQDVANAMAQGYSVVASPLRTANALQRAENNLKGR